MRLLGSFILILLFAMRLAGQSLVSVTPSQAMAGTQLNVTISGQGTHFAQGTATWLYFSQASQTYLYPQSIIPNSNTSLTANLFLPFGTSTGAYDLTLYTQYDGMMWLPNAFIVYPNPNPPQLTGVSPATGQVNTALTVTISGQNTHFTQGSTSFHFSQGSSTVYPNYVQINSNTSMMAEMFWPAWLSPGYLDLNYHNSTDGNLMLPSAIWLMPAAGLPQLLSISPDSAEQGQSLNVGISGQHTHFLQGTGAVTWMSKGFSVIYPVFMSTPSDTLISANYSIPLSAPTGAWDVVVQSTYDGALVLPGAFLVLDQVIHVRDLLARSFPGVYPNPTNGHLYVELPATDIELRLFNSGGELLLSRHFPAGTGTPDIDISHLAPGSYLLEVRADGRQSVHKIIKQSSY